MSFGAMKMNDEPILNLELSDEVNNRTERVHISFSEIYSIEEIQKTNVSKQKDIFYCLNLKNGKNFPISKKLYQLINDLIDKNPNHPEYGRKL